MKDIEKTIGNIIDKQSIAFISSVDDEGFPNTKVMLAPRKRIGIKEFYFTTNTSSLKVKHFLINPKSCIYFYDKRFFKGIMFKGITEILQDKNNKEMIWQDGDTIYYPKGINDPDYCILKFIANKGRYYSNFKSEDFDI